MPKVKDLIKWLQDQYDPEDVIAYSLWTTEDINAIEEEEEIELTEEEAERVLEWADRKEDASIGINWDVLRYYVDEFIRERIEK